MIVQLSSPMEIDTNDNSWIQTEQTDSDNTMADQGVRMTNSNSWTDDLPLIYSSVNKRSRTATSHTAHYLTASHTLSTITSDPLGSTFTQLLLLKIIIRQEKKNFSSLLVQSLFQLSKLWCSFTLLTSGCKGVYFLWSCFPLCHEKITKNWNTFFILINENREFQFTQKGQVPKKQV